MAHQLRLHEDHNFVAITCDDPVSPGEIESIIEALRDIAESRPRLAAIADFRGCHLGCTSEELRHLASRARIAAHAMGPSKWAIVADDDLSFGLGRMFCAYASNPPVEAQSFRGLAATARWLDIDVPVIEGRLVRLGQT